MGGESTTGAAAQGGTGANEPASQPVSPGSPWGALAPILTTLVTGVGLLSFVAFFGGAILWTQADSAGLPASETVALVPKSVLLSTGAHFLTSAILLALFGVGLLWVYDAVLRDRLLGRSEVREQETEQRRADLQKQFEDTKARLTAAEEASSLAAKAKAGALQAAAADPHNEVYVAAVREATDAHTRAERESNSAADRVQEIEHEMPLLEQKAAEARRERERREVWTRLTLLGIPLLGLELALTTFASIVWYDYVALVALSAATTSIILVVYAETERFTWFAVSAFLAIGLYVGFTAYFRTRDNPKAEPAAALVDGRLPITGYFIAQTSDRIYFGIPPQGPSPARMVALRRNDVVALAVGRSLPIGRDRALNAAKALATSLCSDLVAGVADAGRGGSGSAAPVCQQPR